MPPRITIANAFAAARSPMVGVTTKIGPSSAPAAAASPEPSAKVAVWMRSIDTPISAAAVAILEGRPHRHAEPRVVDERVGPGDERDRHHEHEHPVPRHRHCAEDERVRRETGSRSTARRRSRRAARCSAARSRRRSSPASRCRCRTSAAGAAARARSRRRARRRAPIASARARKKFDAELHHQRIHHVGAVGVELAVGEVDHAHDAEDQREADPQQRIGPSQHEGVEAMLEELGHGDGIGVGRETTLSRRRGDASGLATLGRMSWWDHLSPRAGRGRIAPAIRVRGRRRESERRTRFLSDSDSWRRPLTPTLSPHAGRAELYIRVTLPFSILIR